MYRGFNIVVVGALYCNCDGPRLYIYTRVVMIGR